MNHQENLSVKGMIWDIPPSNEKAARALIDQNSSIPLPVASIMSRRGVTPSNLDFYLNAKIRDSLPDPSIFKDMDKGVKHIADDIQQGRKIAIWSDYDCDGVTSAATLKNFFSMIGAGDIDVRIPDRISEGYGPNTKGLLEMKESGIDSVCILDSGIVAFEPLEEADKAGLSVIVIDHHAAEERLPKAVAMINANRLDENNEFGHLCAAGMVFIFCVGLARELNNRGWFDGKDGRPSQIPQDKMMALLDVVALGTVADVVPLTGLNRAFVTRGLEYLNKRKNLGLTQLCLSAGKHPRDKIDAMDLGWKLGPRINACGRIGDVMMALRLLVTDHLKESVEIASAMENVNSKRRAISEKVTEKAHEQLKDRVPGKDRRIAIAVVEDAHEGVIGISAGHIKEILMSPTIILAKGDDGNLKGSGRSMDGFNLGAAIIEARNKDLLIKGGGHAAAAGLTIDPEKLDIFENFMNEKIKESDYFTQPFKKEVDVTLSPSQMNVMIIDSFSIMEPFGSGNPEPNVVIEGAVVGEIRVLKGKHLKITFKGGKSPFDGLIWSAVGEPIDHFLKGKINQKIDILGQVQINEFNGNQSPQIIIDDMREHRRSLI